MVVVVEGGGMGDELMSSYWREGEERGGERERERRPLLREVA